MKSRLQYEQPSMEVITLPTNSEVITESVVGPGGWTGDYSVDPGHDVQ